MSRPAVGWLQSSGGEELEVARRIAERLADVRHVTDVAAAERLLTETPLRLLLLVQARRGEWTQADCERLHAAAPLTHLVGLHGSWCEGWQRTGHPWRGVEHLYWHQLAGRLPVLLSEPAAPRTSQFGDQRAGARLPQPRGGAAVAVSAAADGRDALGDAIAAAGCRTAADGGPCDAAIWDGDPRRDDDLRRLRSWSQQHADVPRLALTLAPRIDDWRLLESHAETIISKPFLLEDLLFWLARAIA